MPDQSFPSWQERYEAAHSMLLALGTAVQEMRALQQQRRPWEPMAATAARAEVEEHVDHLISTLLLPLIPPKPEGM